MKRAATILLALTLCVPSWAKHTHKSTHHRTTHTGTYSGRKATATCNVGTTSYSQPVAEPAAIMEESGSGTDG